MIFDISNSLTLMFTMENVTLILTIISMAVFLGVVTISRRIKSFYFQILIFIILYFVGELIENNQIRNALFSSISSDVGSQIHMLAAMFFAIVMIIRFFFSRQAGKKINDKIT